MGIFGIGIDEKISSLKELITRNITKFSDWIQYFQQKNREQDARIAEIERKLMQTSNPEQMQYVFSRMNDLESSKFDMQSRQKLDFVYQKIREIEQKEEPIEHIQALSRNQIFMLNKIKEIEDKLAKRDEISQPIRAVQTSTAHEKMVKKVAQKSKEYIKNSVMNIIKKYEKITGSQLKEILVDEQGLCSKSSFYRILDEIEQEEKIKSVRDGREKTYQLLHVLR